MYMKYQLLEDLKYLSWRANKDATVINKKYTQTQGSNYVSVLWGHYPPNDINYDKLVILIRDEGCGA